MHENDAPYLYGGTEEVKEPPLKEKCHGFKEFSFVWPCLQVFPVGGEKWHRPNIKLSDHMDILKYIASKETL